MLTISVAAEETSKLTPTSCCRWPPRSNAVGESGPSEALTVSVGLVGPDGAADVPDEAAPGEAANAADEGPCRAPRR